MCKVNCCNKNKAPQEITPAELKIRRWMKITSWIGWAMVLANALLWVSAMIVIAVMGLLPSFMRIINDPGRMLLLLILAEPAAFFLSFYVFRRLLGKVFTYTALGKFCLVLIHPGTLQRDALRVWATVYVLGSCIMFALVAPLVFAFPSSSPTGSTVFSAVFYIAIIPALLYFLYLDKQTKASHLLIMDVLQQPGEPSTNNPGNAKNLVASLACTMLFIVAILWLSPALPTENTKEAVQIYVTALDSIDQKGPPAVNGIVSLLKENPNSSSWTDEKRASLHSYVSELQQNAAAARLLTPPSSLRDVHTLWLTALDKYAQGAIILNGWPDPGSNSSEMARGIALLQEGNDYMNQARALLDKIIQMSSSTPGATGG